VKPFCPLCECKPLFPISRVDRDISPSPPQLPQGENQMQLLCESRLNKYTNVQKTNTSILGHGDMILVKNTCITFFGVCNHRDQWARWHELMCQFWKLWNRLIADEWKGQWERRWWSFFFLPGGAGHYFCELICEWFLQTYNVQCNFSGNNHSKKALQLQIFIPIYRAHQRNALLFFALQRGFNTKY